MDQLSDEITTQAQQPIMRIRDLRKDYTLGDNVVSALQGINLDIFSGEFVAIMGPSGSGKSTLMNILGCLDRPSGGAYWLDGIAVSAMSRDELADVRNRKIGFVFQSFNLLSVMSAMENIELPLLYTDTPADVRMDRVLTALELVGLYTRAYHRPVQLSGG
ncbi:MAG TPA: ABC transporter ATP-binding protein, partial [Ktedonobacteraceae bacterium]|nr:ABC transporter ATP-binding protein [Ktedonobacteraceae bacterium]